MTEKKPTFPFRSRLLSNLAGLSGASSWELASSLSSSLRAPRLWTNANASAPRPCLGSDDAIQGLKFGSVCQNPCRCFQYGKHFSSFSGLKRSYQFDETEIMHTTHRPNFSHHFPSPYLHIVSQHLISQDPH